jgi:hypothetical protein
MGRIPVSQLRRPRYLLRRDIVAVLFHRGETVLTRGRRPTESCSLQSPRFLALPLPIRRARPHLPSNPAIKGLTKRPRLESPLESPRTLSGFRRGASKSRHVTGGGHRCTLSWFALRPELFDSSTRKVVAGITAARADGLRSRKAGRQKGRLAVLSAARKDRAAATTSWPPRPRPLPLLPRRTTRRGIMFSAAHPGY